ncbi:MAG TPA: hypothetical protein DDY17_06980 [Syntrophaceae bacterium]|jgi:hypothetical protein|nr:hypothetical protein [Syntrophaceae bacterium]
MTMNSIRIKAGRKALEIIRDGGFQFDRITTYFGPATGPRWLIASGFDLTLLQHGILGCTKAVHLVGASAGAWRLSAWLQPEPEDSYRNLMESYIGTIYKRGDTPQVVLESLKKIVNSYIEDDALPFALANKKYRLTIITARAKNLVASELKWVQQVGLGICFLFNAVNRSYIHDFAERVVFYNGPMPPHFCLVPGFQGRYIRLNPINFKYALMASGAIPLVVAGIKNIYGAPNGIYRDGGLIDYHLTHNYSHTGEDIILFFNHQERIIPGWLDKKLSYRRPNAGVLDNVLMIHPSDAFVDRLPGRKIPDRDDFALFIDDPATRMRNWREAVRQAEPLGEEFLELVESKKIRNVVEKIKID